MPKKLFTLKNIEASGKWVLAITSLLVLVIHCVKYILFELLH